MLYTIINNKYLILMNIIECLPILIEYLACGK